MVNQDDLKYIQILWDFMKLNQPLKKSDFIIVLGCADIKVADVAIDVYNQGLSDKIIFSGGLGKITKNIWKIPEANKFAALAEKRGVPKEKIYIDFLFGMRKSDGARNQLSLLWTRTRWCLFRY